MYNRKQYSSKEDLWEVIKATTSNVKIVEIIEN